MKISEALEKAADIQEKYGHCQFTWENDAGQHCVQGSIAAAVGLGFRQVDIDTRVIDYRGPVDEDVYCLFEASNETLLQYLKDSGADWKGTYLFNDDPETEGPDVVRALREASAWQREREELEEPIEVLVEEEVSA